MIRFAWLSQKRRKVSGDRLSSIQLKLHDFGPTFTILQARRAERMCCHFAHSGRGDKLECKNALSDLRKPNSLSRRASQLRKRNNSQSNAIRSVSPRDGEHRSGTITDRTKIDTEIWSHERGAEFCELNRQVPHNVPSFRHAVEFQSDSCSPQSHAIRQPSSTITIQD